MFEENLAVPGDLDAAALAFEDGAFITLFWRATSTKVCR
jgi:hypothetical protein